MAELITIFIFFGVIIVTVLIFSIWVVGSVVGFIFKSLLAVGRMLTPNASPRPAMPMIGRGPTCTNQQCRAINPQNARFCRRCGGSLPQPQQVIARRAAVL